MSTPPNPENIARRFNDCINRKDVDGLGRLMSDDHCLIDIEDEMDEGKQSCLESWTGFFEIFPDFKNVARKVVTDGNTVTIEGTSECSDKRLAGPAIWTAKINGDKISEWRVYEDTPETRKKLNLK